MASKKKKVTPSQKQQSRPRNQIGTNIKTYTCPICDITFTKRHFAAHMKRFHENESPPPRRKAPPEGIKSVNVKELSPEFREKMSQQNVIDEDGFLRPVETHIPALPSHDKN